MKYRRITQEAKVFEFGKGKVFDSKKLALEEAEKEKKDLNNFCLKHKKKTEKTEIKILETDKSIQLLLYVYVPVAN